MNSKLEGRYKMQLACEVVLDQNVRITGTLPNFVPLYSKYKTNILQIQVLREQKETGTMGISASKENLKIKLVSKTLEVSRKTEAFATLGNNTILAKEVHFSSTALSRVSDATLKDRALLVYNKALANIASLGPYDVNEESLAEMKTLIDSFQSSIPNIRLGKSGQKQTYSQMKQLYKENDEILAKIDLLVEIVRTKEASFYNSYKDIRRVIDSGRTSLAAKGITLDAETSQPLKRVSLLIALEKSKNSSSNVPLLKKSSERGRFNIKSLAPGIYYVTASKMGYITNVTRLIINSGEQTYLEISMQKI